MRFIPATRIGVALATPTSRRARVTGRIAAGSIAAAGAFALLGNGHAADAKTLTSSKTATSKSTAGSPTVAPTPVNKYVVVKGDTLSEIAERSGVSLNALAKANGISVRKTIVVGQHLVIPTGKAVSLPSAKVSTKGVVPTDLPPDSSRFGLKSSFQSAASTYGVPLDLLQAVTWQESGWQHDAVSHTGAIGIGQLMPDAVSYVNTYLVKRPLNPNTDDGNIRIAASYLHYLINENKGDYKTALAAYYQGQSSVRKNGVMSDTKAYVANVLALKARYF